MKILREAVGYSEEIDLDDPQQYVEFVHLVVQDEEAAEELIAEIDRVGWAEVNIDQPEFYERYTKIGE